MKWNPLFNAAAAALYISGIGLLFQYISSIRSDTPDTFLDPILALSLLVFSVAVMGFLFFYHPVVLLLDNKRKEAVSYFLKTLGIFGAIIVLMVVALSFL